MALLTQRPYFDWLQLVRCLCYHYPRHSQYTMALIAIAQQCSYLVRGLHLFASFPISSSRFGLGCQLHSWQTPKGVHRVANKIGDGAPLLSCFRARRLDGQCAKLNPYPTISDSDTICTRIIHLAGLEPGYNQGGSVDSYQRYIYIHGTVDEKRIGRPASIGCIRMRNHDLCQLYDSLSVDSLVCILDH